MELFRSDTHFIFVKGSHSLWWNKQTGDFSAKSGKNDITLWLKKLLIHIHIHLVDLGCHVSLYTHIQRPISRIHELRFLSSAFFSDLSNLIQSMKFLFFVLTTPLERNYNYDFVGKRKILPK